MIIKKTISIQNEIPKIFNINHLGNNLFELLLHQDIQEIYIENDLTYKSILIFASGEFENADELKGALIRLKYSKDKEYSLINKGIENKENIDYIEYREFVKICKNFVDDYLEEKKLLNY